MPIFINIAIKFGLFDIPNSRKIHFDPIPRIGGIVMALGAVTAIILFAPRDEFVKSIMIGSGILIIFGFVDDFKGIGFKSKFTGQILAALIVIIYGGIKINTLSMFNPSGFYMSDWLSIPFTILIIVAVTNAINLSDGLDGLAGGFTLLTFLCIGYISYLDNILGVKIISIATVGALFGLLRYNTHPASVFMGDAGSQLLGFLAITLSLALTRISNQISIIITLLIMGIPVIDTFFVVAQRIVKGRSPFIADKNHLHHKLLQLGLHHSESVLTLYLLHAILVCFGFIFRFKSPWFLLSFYIIFSCTLLIVIFIADRFKWRIKRSNFLKSFINEQFSSLKDSSIYIKFSFRAVEFGFIFLLLFSCFIPKFIHIYFSISTIIVLSIIFLAWRMNKSWVSSIIDISTFLIIPFLIYLSETDAIYLAEATLNKAYSLSFALLILFVLLTLKFSRRKGFRSTPLDFLILFVALVIPNLPDVKIQSWQVGFIAAKIVILYFTYEVLKGELRTDKKRLRIASIMALIFISIRGFIG